jgi:hypothetical protein
MQFVEDLLLLKLSTEFMIFIVKHEQLFSNILEHFASIIGVRKGKNLGWGTESNFPHCA